jgi:hypothetical protein
MKPIVVGPLWEREYWLVIYARKNPNAINAKTILPCKAFVTEKKAKKWMETTKNTVLMMTNVFVSVNVTENEEP